MLKFLIKIALSAIVFCGIVITALTVVIGSSLASYYWEGIVAEYRTFLLERAAFGVVPNMNERCNASEAKPPMAHLMKKMHCIEMRGKRAEYWINYTAPWNLKAANGSLPFWLSCEEVNRIVLDVNKRINSSANRDEFYEFILKDKAENFYSGYEYDEKMRLARVYVKTYPISEIIRGFEKLRMSVSCNLQGDQPFTFERRSWWDIF